MTIIIRHPPMRFLPEYLLAKKWVDLDDHSAVAEGDYLYEPKLAYAGKVISIYKGRITIDWYKHANEQPLEETISLMTFMHRTYWWADPMLQEGGDR